MKSKLFALQSEVILAEALIFQGDFKDMVAKACVMDRTACKLNGFVAGVECTGITFSLFWCNLPCVTLHMIFVIYTAIKVRNVSRMGETRIPHGNFVRRPLGKRSFGR
jgi:hypothetical protein